MMYICNKAFIGDKRCQNCRISIPHPFEKGCCGIVRICSATMMPVECKEYKKEKNEITKWLERWYNKI
jgi:hypothetical protein